MEFELPTKKVLGVKSGMITGRNVSKKTT